MPLLRTLPPFLLGRWRLGFEPGFDGGILREEVGHVRDEILDDREVWQWIDPYRPFNIADRLSACDRVGAVDIHRAAAADPLATRSSEHEGGIDPVLDEKKSIQDHGTAFVEIDVIGVDPGTLVPIGIEPIYLERFGAPCAFGRRPNLACTNLGVSRQPNIQQKSSHVRALDYRISHPGGKLAELLHDPSVNADQFSTKPR